MVEKMQGKKVKLVRDFGELNGVVYRVGSMWNLGSGGEGKNNTEFCAQETETRSTPED